MKLSKHATLIGGIIFVVAASIFVETMEREPLPVEVANTLDLRQALFICRSIPPPGSTAFEAPKAGDISSLQTMNSMVVDILKPLASMSFVDEGDHLAAATAAAAVDGRHLIGLFLSRIQSGPGKSGADVLLKWAFDPGFVPGQTDLQALREMPVQPWVAEIAVSTIMRGFAADLPEQTSRLARWNRTTLISGITMTVGFAALIWGLVAWFRWRRRQIAEVIRGRNPEALTGSPLGGLFSTYIWFTAFFLAVNLLLPEWLNGLNLGVALQSLIIYTITGVGGFVIATASGKSESERDFKAILGLNTRPPEPPPPFVRDKTLLSGIRGWAMIWPILILATAIGSLFGDSANGLDNPMALFLTTETGSTERVILVLAAAVLAPIFEEPLFRGFFYRRFRRILSPYGAAAASGFIFAAAHFSSSGFLSLWAIGFTLGLTYESSGKLGSSMLAHALWNLGTSAGILALYG